MHKLHTKYCLVPRRHSALVARGALCVMGLINGAPRPLFCRLTALVDRRVGTRPHKMYHKCA